MGKIRAEDAIAAKGRPFTGAEYLESLRDGREVWIHGERVEDVTTHPAFRNAARERAASATNESPGGMVPWSTG